MKNERGNLIIGYIIVLILAACVWLALAFMEAHTFNRITGSRVSAWDCLWVNMAVTGDDLQEGN